MDKHEELVEQVDALEVFSSGKFLLKDFIHSICKLDRYIILIKIILINLLLDKLFVIFRHVI